MENNLAIKNEAFGVLLKREFKVMNDWFEELDIPVCDNNEQLDIVPEVTIDRIMTFNRNLQALGFMLGADIIDKMQKSSLCSVVAVENKLIEVIEDIVGMKIVDAKIMYPNFPIQVMEMEESELYLNAIIHYLSFGQLLPEYEVEDREKMETDLSNLKAITLGSMKDLDKTFKSICSSSVAVSEYDMELVTWYINFVENVGKLIPNEIPNKENKAKITDFVMKYKPEMIDCLYSMYKTSTDVLRLAVSMSGGDVTLSSKTEFRKFKRSERRCLLALLNKCGNLTEDMFRNRETWLRLGERLNPGDYKKFKKALASFSLLRANKKPETFYSKVEKAFATGEVEKVCEVLQERPGEFARALNRTLSITEDTDKQMEIASVYGEVVYKVSTQVLWSVITFFRDRKSTESRTFFPKGNIVRPFMIENNLSDISEDVIDYVVKTSMRGLISQYATRETLGRVYIEPDMVGYKMPTVMRDMNESMRTIARGSRVKINTDKNILRAFTYWKNDCDVDLSVLALDSDLKLKSSCSYTDLKDNKLGLYHSGDIVDGSCGASEFVDIDIKKCKEADVRYILVALNSFSHIGFCEMEECFCGIMARDTVVKEAVNRSNKGNVFEPSTILNKTDISSKSMQSTPMVVDLETMEYIWLDLPIFFDGFSVQANNIHTNENILVNTLRGVLNSKLPNIDEVVRLNVRARMGEIVYTVEEADFIIGESEKANLKPHQLSELASNWL